MSIKIKNKKGAFTLVELLTALAVIGILVALLIPALNMVQGSAQKVRQKAQFHTIEIGLEAFRSDFGEYPESSRELIPENYCGAQKLAEALVGQDGFGVHPDTQFLSDGTDIDGTPLYRPDIDPLPPSFVKENLDSRKGPYLELEAANALKVSAIYGDVASLPVDIADTFVFADKFGAVTQGGKKVGMPILYYRADTTKFEHNTPQDYDDGTNVSPLDCIYNYNNNLDFTQTLASPIDGVKHPMDDPEIFYKLITNPNYTDIPYRKESFLLISAGPDGKYGTPDDVMNIEEAK